MLDEIKQDAKGRMAKSIDALEVALKRVRTGRAHPSILDGVMVEYYGADTPLKQLANVSVEDGRTLTVSPFEKQLIADVERAIMKSDLGLNPSNSGDIIRIPMPPLTEETRRNMVKIVKGEAENSRIAIRNIRRDANADFKELLKEKEISEDEARKAEEDIQKLTNEFVTEVEETIKRKEADLMEV